MCDQTKTDQDGSLGFIDAPKAFANDLEVLKQYQSFSAELLRLSLLGLTALAVLIFAVIKDDKIKIDELSRYLIITSSVLFGMSAAAALAHRYSSSDGLTLHLEALRYELRGRDSDRDSAEAAKKARKHMFLCAEWSLWVSSIALALGAIAFAAGIGYAVMS